MPCTQHVCRDYHTTENLFCKYVVNTVGQKRKNLAVHELTCKSKLQGMSGTFMEEFESVLLNNHNHSSDFYVSTADNKLLDLHPSKYSVVFTYYDHTVWGIMKPIVYTKSRTTKDKDRGVHRTTSRNGDFMEPSRVGFLLDLTILEA